MMNNVELNVTDSKSMNKAEVRGNRVLVKWNYKAKGQADFARGRYLNVSDEVIEELINSDRPSEFIRLNLKGKFDYESF